MNLKLIYWSSTGIVILFLIWSAYTYLFHKTTIEGIQALGFPHFFRIQLAILKCIAVIILLIPQIPISVKEWAYSGVTLFFITAIIAHVAHKDPIVITVINIVLIGITWTSNWSLHALK